MAPKKPTSRVKRPTPLISAQAMPAANGPKETADDALDRCLAGEIVRAVECGFETKAGRELPGMFTLKLLTDDRGQPDAICMIAKHLVA